MRDYYLKFIFVLSLDFRFNTIFNIIYLDKKQLFYMSIIGFIYLNMLQQFFFYLGLFLLMQKKVYKNQTNFKNKIQSKKI